MKILLLVSLVASACQVRASSIAIEHVNVVDARTATTFWCGQA